MTPPTIHITGALDTLAQFISTVQRLGVTRLVMVTGRGESHAKLAEDILLSSAGAVTILRSAWFAQNFSEGSLLEPMSDGVIPMPGDDPGEPVGDLDDFAEAAAQVLTQPGHDGKIYDITGRRPLPLRKRRQYYHRLPAVVFSTQPSVMNNSTKRLPQPQVASLPSKPLPPAIGLLQANVNN